MFRIGPWEIVVIVIVALVFIRPRDLPLLLRRVGRFFAQLRSLRDDITRSLSEVERDLESPAPGGEDSAPVSTAPDLIEKPEGNGRPSQGVER